MKTFKINFIVQRLYFLIFLFLFQACNGQETTDIDKIKKNMATNIGKVSYSGIVDFRVAAKVATPAVVNIKSTFKSGNAERNQQNFHDIPDELKDFFNEDPFFRQFKFRTPNESEYESQPVIGSASGVIITADGYIVTNNHVIKNADEIEVTLFDGRTYPAKLIGNDPQTDLALLKIDEKGLSFILFGDSDSIEVGEWVVAVGNPFNLASTVTAGIVSAKARNINILDNQGAIESFIQTDAAVNPGNSGGALVSLEGKLIGINTAIATPTGVYAGYAFAIPVEIVQKVTNDLMNFGSVQRGILGITISNLNSSLAKELNINRANGVYVNELMDDGAAKKGGIKKKDVIIAVDGTETPNVSTLQEIISIKNPGDKVKITLIRNGNEKKEVTVTLQKYVESEVMANSNLLKELGVELEELSKEDLKKYNLKNGLKITKLYNGILKNHTDIRVGFVITSVNKKQLNTVQSFIKAIEGQKGGIMLEGKYAGDSRIYYYAFGM